MVRKRKAEEAASPTDEGAVQAFVVRLPRAIDRALRHVAIDKDRTLNDIVIEAIETWGASQPAYGKYRGEAADESKPRRR